MIERDILSRKIKEFQVKEFLEKQLFGAGYSATEIKRTPLGEKIIIFTSRPGMVVGRSGKNIKDLTAALKTKFKLENPQIEISEVKNTALDADIMAEKIAVSLQRFGSNRFKNIIHKAAEEIMRSGAKGVEILLSGKVPSARARTWRISQGYLKKCGEPALVNVNISYKIAKIKSGVVGIVVKIMPPNVRLPDYMALKVEEEIVVEDKTEEISPEKKLEEIKKKAEKESKKKDVVKKDKQKEKTTKKLKETVVEETTTEKKKEEKITEPAKEEKKPAKKTETKPVKKTKTTKKK